MSWREDEAPLASQAVSTFVPTDGSDPLLFDSATSQLHRLKGTAGAVWAAIDGQRTVDEIVALIVDLYDVGADGVERSVVGADIENALDQFSQRGLLRG